VAGQMNKIRIIRFRDERIEGVDPFAVFWVEMVILSDRYDITIGHNEYSNN
jgi:hypothetical protein